MSALRQAPRSGRRALLVVAGLAVIVGLIVVFSGSLTRSTDIEARAELARTEIAALEDIAAAGQAELAFFGTDAFVSWQSRVYGFGDKSAGEKRFGLPDNAPPPDSLVPIGPERDSTGAMTPFDAWMELLFGA
jgi:hypothetical protein